MSRCSAALHQVKSQLTQVRLDCVIEVVVTNGRGQPDYPGGGGCCGVAER